MGKVLVIHVGDKVKGSGEAAQVVLTLLLEMQDHQIHCHCFIVREVDIDNGLPRSYISHVPTNYTFATVYKGRQTKEMSVIDENAHVAVRLQLLEMSSITTPNQTISNLCTRYNILRALF